MRAKCRCGKPASQRHHIHYRSQGGSDADENLAPMCDDCHRRLHSERGDFREWGRIGGQRTAESKKSLSNLKQYQNNPDRLWRDLEVNRD